MSLGLRPVNHTELQLEPLMSHSAKLIPKAIQAACSLNLQLTCEGHGTDTIEAFNKIILDFIHVFSRFSVGLSVEEAVSLWRCSYDNYGKLVLDN
jgi:hypothetical protein